MDVSVVQTMQKLLTPDEYFIQPWKIHTLISPGQYGLDTLYTVWGQGQKEKGKEKTLTFPLIAD